MDKFKEPSDMTPTEILSEVASILAIGYVRLSKSLDYHPSRAENGLDSLDDQSVHGAQIRD